MTMKNSVHFFENRDCEYFPCHDLKGGFNCLFCYCPMYFLKDCPGNYYYTEKEDARIKVCTNCTFPHKPENYGEIIKLLRSAVREGFDT